MTGPPDRPAPDPGPGAPDPARPGPDPAGGAPEPDRAAGWPGRLRLAVVLVQGPSMAPALRHGDALLVRRARSARPGDVVVVRFPGQPGLFVKRAVRPAAGGWWVRGDNRYASDDSERYGAAEIVARVLLRYWPRPSRVPRVHCR